MATDRNDIAAIWRQPTIPIVYRRAGSNPLMVRLPYAEDNKIWLRNGNHRQPEWDNQFKCWLVPKSWLNDITTRLLQRFRKTYIIQPYRAQEKCAPACWNAQGFECQCSCMGANHGSQSSGGGWHVVSDTFAVRWHDRELACRLLEAK